MRARDVQEWEPLPVSRATNALELLEEVIKLIEEEPLRYNQGDWLQRIRQFYLSPGSAPISTPACGTVGCVAGWVVILIQDVPGYASDAAHFAEGILGITRSQRYDLFDGAAVSRQYVRENPEVLGELNNKREYGDDWTMDDVNDIEIDIGYSDNMPPQGTPEYAALGVRHIRRFIDANREQLAAFPITTRKSESKVVPHANPA